MSDSAAASNNALAAPAAGVAQRSPMLTPAPLVPMHKSPAIKALAPLPSTQATAAATAAPATSDSAAAVADGGALPSLTLGATAAGETTTAVAAAATPAAAAPLHELHQRWTFWHDVSDQTGGKPKEWGMSLVKLYEFNTIEHFWSGENKQPEATPRPAREQSAHFLSHCCSSLLASGV